MFHDKIVDLGITFDDVLLLLANSEIIPSEVDVSRQLTQQIRMQIPRLLLPADCDDFSDFHVRFLAPFCLPGTGIPAWRLWK